ncbi:LysR family transcriptional regulator, partial [Mesorhizobium sp. M7A.F.Ca.CA.004.05.2.1]|uniref:helix-turn-helix domain-containing protein n=1 Tax=Mesorhizobium sp. M7A.F.Ca.CA.004.05.2.1 TaxID=2496716 RepID=UPI001FE1F494
MPKHFRMIDNACRTLTAIENSAVDELLAGRMDRRDFLRHGSVLGLSLPFLGSLVAASRLNLAQSTVSARIRGLEEQLGRRLFVRDR